MTDEGLIKALDRLKTTMISVSTGGPEIGRVEAQFSFLYDEVDSELRARAIENPLPYRSLWDWYGRWKQGDLPTYQSRREFVNDMFAPALNRLRERPGKPYEPTGWARVDRTAREIRQRFASANTKSSFRPWDYSAVSSLFRRRKKCSIRTNTPPWTACLPAKQMPAGC